MITSMMVLIPNTSECVLPNNPYIRTAYFIWAYQTYKVCDYCIFVSFLDDILSLSYFHFVSILCTKFHPLLDQYTDSIVSPPMCLLASVCVNSSGFDL